MQAENSLKSENVNTGEKNTEIDSAANTRLLSDEAEIRALVAAFADSANRNDMKQFAGLWLPDAVLKIGEPFPSRAEGAAKIVEMIGGMLNAWDFFVHLVYSGVVETKGDEATARWTIQEMGRSRDGKRFYNNFGYYFDRLVRQDNRWLFAERKYAYIYIDDGPLTGKAYQLPKTF